MPVADRAMLHADNAYFLPAVRIESSPVADAIRKAATAFRGFGGPQGMLGMERIVDARGAWSWGWMHGRRFGSGTYYRGAPGAERPSGRRFEAKMKPGSGARVDSGSGRGSRFGSAHSPVAVGGDKLTPYGHGG